jgi:hypothetical protein
MPFLIYFKFFWELTYSHLYVYRYSVSNLIAFLVVIFVNTPLRKKFRIYTHTHTKKTECLKNLCAPNLNDALYSFRKMMNGHCEFLYMCETVFLHKQHPNNSAGSCAFIWSWVVPTAGWGRGFHRPMSITHTQSTHHIKKCNVFKKHSVCDSNKTFMRVQMETNTEIQ